MCSNGNTPATSSGSQPQAKPAPPKAPPPRHLLNNPLLKATEKAAIFAQISKFGRTYDLQQSTVDALKRLPAEAAEKIMNEMLSGLSNADAFVRDRTRSAAIENQDHALAASLANTNGWHVVRESPIAAKQAGETAQVLLGPLQRPVTVPVAAAAKTDKDLLQRPVTVPVAAAERPVNVPVAAAAKTDKESRWTCSQCDEVNRDSRLECNNCRAKRPEVWDEAALLERKSQRSTEAKRDRWRRGLEGMEQTAATSSRDPGNLKPLTPMDAKAPPLMPPPWGVAPPPHFFSPQAWAMYGQMAFAQQYHAQKMEKKKKKEKKKTKAKKRSRTRSKSSCSSRSSACCKSRSKSRARLSGRNVAKAPAVSSKARSIPERRPGNILNEDVSRRNIAELSPLREISPTQPRRQVETSDKSPPQAFTTSQVSTPVSMSSDASKAPMADVSWTQNGSGKETSIAVRTEAENGSSPPTNGGEGDGKWPAGSQEQQLHEWLEQLDGGRGVLLQYFDSLRREFSADLDRIKEMRLANPRSGGILGTIDTYFWELCGIKQMGHRLLLAKGINALQ